MAVAGFYRRILPSPPAVDFSSLEGKQLFREALLDGTMEGFFKLIPYFQTQSEPAYCGLATLSVVLNALAIDPGRKWKGPWRWFDESMLDCCEPLEKVKAEGITFGKVACLANCAGAKVNAFRANQTSIDEFRAFIKKCATSEDSHVIASYHRAPFKQTGSGHFSPIGGYHARRDMALILDVARFKYPPHWVPLSLLWEAMNTMDESTQHYRGFMIISKRQQAPSLLYTLSCRHESWKSISNYLMEEVPRLLKAEGIDSIQKVFSVIFASLPANVTDFVKWIAEVRRLESSEKTVDNEEADRLAVKAEILQQIRATELYKTVNEWMSSATRCCNLSWSTEDNLSEIASHVCCQAAATLCGMLGTTEGSCCRKYCIKVIETNDNMPLTVVSGTVITNGAEQGVDMLIPNAGQVKHPVCHMHKVEGSSANWLHMYPASGDVLTILLLALPPQTWHELQEKGLQEKIYHIVSIADLSAGLQEEVVNSPRKGAKIKAYSHQQSSSATFTSSTLPCA